MNGRIEKDNILKMKIEKKIEDLPKIFTTFYHWMDVKEMSYTSIRNYINHVVDFMNFITKNSPNDDFFKNITEDDINEYLISIRTKEVNGIIKEMGDDIRSAKWSSLNTFFKFLTYKKFITDNPMKLTERPRNKTEHKIVYLTPEEINSVFSRIQNEARPMTKNRDMCIVALGLSTGLRVSAISNINVEDIDFQSNSIKVIEKGKKTREIKFANNMRNLLKLYLRDREYLFKKTGDGPLFLSQLKNRISVDSIQDIVTKYTNHLDKHISPHKLRSSAAMNLHGAGVDLLTIASLLGHEQVTTTQRYAMAYDEDKQNATNILDELI